MIINSCIAFLFLVVVLFVFPSTQHWQPDLQIKFIRKSNSGFSAKPNLCFLWGFVKINNTESGDNYYTSDNDVNALQRKFTLPAA